MKTIPKLVQCFKDYTRNIPKYRYKSKRTEKMVSTLFFS